MQVQIFDQRTLAVDDSPLVFHGSLLRCDNCMQLFQLASCRLCSGRAILERISCPLKFKFQLLDSSCPEICEFFKFCNSQL